MRDINRIDKLLNELGELWKKQPDMRFGQLIMNLDLSLNDNSIMWNKEDEDWLKLIQNKKDEWKSE